MPVSLNTTLRSDKSRNGDAGPATVMQDVPPGRDKSCAPAPRRKVIGPKP
jgi:hypothetical protein